MRLSARQAWHDCYYIPRDDALARLREFVGGGAAKEARGAIIKQGGQLYCKVWVKEGGQKTFTMVPVVTAKSTERALPDFFMMWDPIWRGKVQAAIKSLPSVLRSFGMFMYAPAGEATPEQVEEVQEAIKLTYYSSMDPEDLKGWRSARFERVHYLALAAMHFYRRGVFGNSAAARPVEIGNFLYEEFGAQIPHLVKNWDRDWAETWKALVTIIDTMEREALGPVARAIADFNEREAA